MRTSLLGAPLLHLSPRLGLPCASREMTAHHLPASRVPRRVPLREWDATAAFSVCPHTPQWPQPSLRARAPAIQGLSGRADTLPAIWHSADLLHSLRASHPERRPAAFG